MREQIARHTSVPARASRRPDVHASSPNGAGHESGLHNEDQPYLTDEQAARHTRSQRPMQQQPLQRRMPPAPADEEEDAAVYSTRLPSSTRRYGDAPAPAAPQRQSAMRVRYGDGDKRRIRERAIETCGTCAGSDRRSRVAKGQCARERLKRW